MINILAEVGVIALFILGITFLCLIIAMLCRSLVHTLLHHYGDFKIKFNVKNDQWWNPGISWTNKRTKFLQTSDAFHFFNTIELGAYTFAITIPTSLWLNTIWYMSVVIFLIIGAILIIIFNIGYDRLWR